MQSRWCGRLDTWILVAGLFPGRLGTWGLVPSFQWPPWETWSSCYPFPGILGKWSLLPSFPLELDHLVDIHMYGQSTTALYWLQGAQLSEIWLPQAFRLRKIEFQCIAYVRSKSMVRPSTAFRRKLLKYLQSQQLLFPTFFGTAGALHIAPQPCQPNWLGTLSFMLDPFYCDQDEIRTVAA